MGEKFKSVVIAERGHCDCHFLAFGGYFQHGDNTVDCPESGGYCVNGDYRDFTAGTA